MRLFDKLGHLENYHREIFDKKSNERYFEIGSIVHKKNTPDSIILEEHGKFEDSRYQNKTLNYYQWQLTAAQQLQLRHLRYSKNKGILLATFDLSAEPFDLSAEPFDLSAEPTIVTSAPYYCGQDSYLAELHYNKHNIVLSWLIKGSKKDLIIKNTYCC